jgi:hypothetical protein
VAALINSARQTGFTPPSASKVETNNQVFAEHHDRVHSWPPDTAIHVLKRARRRLGIFLPEKATGSKRFREPFKIFGAGEGNRSPTVF